MRLHPSVLTLTALLAVTACTVGPRYQVPREAPVLVRSPDPRLISGGTPEPSWWRTFQDPVLDSLISRALGGNLDLRIAVARVREARSLFRDASLDRFPRVATDGTYVRGDEQVPGMSSERVKIEAADVGFDATWEVDLFGRVRHGVKAARANDEAAVADLQNVRVTVAAEVARTYLVLRGTQERRAVAAENLVTARATLQITQARYQIGSGDPIDVESASAQLDAIEATIPALLVAECQAVNRLAVLVDERPGSLDDELEPLTAQLPARATPLPIGDSAGFLRHRPDIQAAERRLAAETERTGVATADLFPRLHVTGFVGLLSGNVSSLFGRGSEAWAVSPVVTWPGLDLGGARARLHAQEARADIARAQYEQTVLGAIEDLQNALVAYGQQQAEVVSRAAQVNASRRAAQLAHARYQEGSIEYLRVLDAERTRLGAEDALTQAKTAANTDVVAVYKALGGV